ncbi:hypothetical protein BV497_08600 [Fulvimonas soli]|nr:hypothetical protein BV497_08600 [Fulvimonas soli]
MAIDPESSNVTTMFGATAWVSFGGVGLSSTAPTGGAAVLAAAAPAKVDSASICAAPALASGVKGADNPPASVSAKPTASACLRPGTKRRIRMA